MDKIVKQLGFESVCQRAAMFSIGMLTAEQRLCPIIKDAIWPVRLSVKLFESSNSRLSNFPSS